MIVLISPAKTINEKTRTSHSLSSTIPPFESKTKKLIRILKKKKVVELEKMMHVSVALAELNHMRYKQFSFPNLEFSESFLEAGSCFNGEVYKGLEFEQFTKDQKLYAQNHLFILSGLYGVLRPLDLLYPYRLEMGTPLKVDEETKNLYAFWSKDITKYIQKQAKDSIILNLASTEYAKAVQFNSLKSRVITPLFKEFKNGKYQTIMMYAKHARGEMAKFVLQNELTDPEVLKGYSLGGYKFVASESTENEWLFVR